MTKNNTKVTVEVRLDESTLMDMVNSGHTPSSLIPKLVEDAWARLNRPDDNDAHLSDSNRDDWDEEGFFDYMDALLLEGEDYKLEEGNSHGFEDVADLIALLLAYWKLGSKPTGQQLIDCLQI